MATPADIQYDFDLFIIGGGSGGVRAARMAGRTGAKVGLAEVGALGGTCVNVGCIPKKLYSYAAGYAEAFEEAAGYGWKLDKPELDWPKLKQRRASEISRLNSIYQGLLDGANVTSMPGYAKLVDAHSVSVELNSNPGAFQTFTAKNILIAVGGRPSVPHVPGAEHVVTSDDMFDLDPFPKRLVIVGGGYIACEFASIFNGLGSTVTLIPRGKKLLTAFDEDASAFVTAEMKKAGIETRMECTVTGITLADDGKTKHVALSSGDVIEADTVLYATGRSPNTKDIGLDKAEVTVDAKGAVVVNDSYETSVPHIFAVGDVSTSIQLTPVALAEAMVVVDRLFGEGKRDMSYEYVPTAVFTHPNMGVVGYTEKDAKEKFGEITVFQTDFKPLRHTLSGSHERTFIKMIVEKKTDRVVGLHMVGADAGEIIQGMGIAMKAGATKAIFDATIGIHPTVAEEFVTLREPRK